LEKRRIGRPHGVLRQNEKRGMRERAARTIVILARRWSAPILRRRTSAKPRAAFFRANAREGEAGIRDVAIQGCRMEGNRQVPVLRRYP
jgi:hypothetical protein